MAQDDPVFKPVGRVAQPAKENDAAADVVREFRVRPCWIRRAHACVSLATPIPRASSPAPSAGPVRRCQVRERASPSPTRMLCSGASPSRRWKRGRL